MTKTTADATLSELKALVDRGLGEINERQLMPTGEVADLLLDVRMLITTLEAESASPVTPESETVPG